MAHSTGAIEYTEFISAEGKDSTNECPRYDTKQSNGSAPALGLCRMQSTPFIVIAPRSALPWSGSTWLDAIYGLNITKQCTYAKLNCLK